MLLAQYGLAAALLLIFAGEIGIPVLIPGELVLLLAGNELLSSAIAVVPACLAFALVDFLASLSLHLAARSGGNALLRLVLRRFTTTGGRPEERVASWRRRFGGYDALVVFAIRVAPGIRISGSLVSGLLRFPLPQFAAGALPASLIWASIPLVLGYMLRSYVGTVSVPDSQTVVRGALGIALLVLVAGSVWWINRSRTSGHAHHSGGDWTSV